MKIVIIGAGISGISAAYHLQNRFEVTILEKNQTIGGHANTVRVKDKENIPHEIDTGFIVYNNTNYPGLLDFFSALKIEPVYTDMSFSFSNESANISYAGTVSGLIPNFTSLFKFQHLNFLKDIYIYSRKLANLDHKILLKEISISGLLKDLGCPLRVIQNYFIPIASAIWSCSYTDAAKIPANSYINFFSNHGLFNIFNRPRWYTVQGGSKTYLSQFSRSFKGSIITNAKVTNVTNNSGVFKINISNNPSIICDKIIVSTHADEAFEILKNLDFVTPETLDILNSYRYTKNNIILHTDESFMPKSKRLWASWNVRTTVLGKRYNNGETTYYMNRLQRLKTATNFFVTLNSSHEPTKNKILYKTEYTHPLLEGSPATIKRNLDKLNNYPNIYFCGSYLGYGFHEDGYQSGLKVANIIKNSLNVE